MAGSKVRVWMEERGVVLEGVEEEALGEEEKVAEVEREDRNYEDRSHYSQCHTDSQHLRPGRRCYCFQYKYLNKSLVLLEVEMEGMVEAVQEGQKAEDKDEVHSRHSLHPSCKLG